MPRSATTRDDLLRATRELLASTPLEGFTLGSVAQRARVSRQAVYLHFASKTELLLALVDWMDEHGRLRRLVGPALAKPDPVERLLAFGKAAASYNADIADVARALRAARETDEAARAAWNDRMQSRLNAMRGVIQAVADVDRLATGWTVRTATDALFTLLGIAVHEDLVRMRGWSQARYEAFVVRSLERLLVADDG